MISASTFQLLRFHFSFFLMPVFWFALSQVVQIEIKDAILIFIILHLLLYPASNGYNSYMDRDTGSIGGIQDPKQPTRQLYYASILLDCLALLLSLFISIYFFAGIALFIAASKAYSYRGIRLKKFPVLGYVTVIFFQGAVIFFLVKHGSSISKTFSVPAIAMIAASFLVGGFYPLTQIYQHHADKKDGVITLSYLLGYRGTFFFTAIIYISAMILLALYFGYNLELDRFLILQLFMLPVLVYFFWWFYKVWHDVRQASYINTMRMNVVASVCTNAGFITLFLIDKY
ncbi:MAG TPA: UbiA family prenyltransferase [Ferruginibacter sp.]|nr:UbiA family prenyltransferase [Ferruginibacter sp.]